MGICFQKQRGTSRCYLENAHGCFALWLGTGVSQLATLGTAAVFEMNFTAFPIVLETASEPDVSAGEASEGLFCVFRKALAK